MQSVKMKRKLNEHDVPEVATSKGKEGSSTKSVFAALNLDSRILKAITREKFTAPTPVQAKAIPLAVDGKDVLGRNRP